MDRVAVGALGDDSVSLGEARHVQAVEGALGRHRIVAHVQDAPGQRVDEQHSRAGDVAGVQEPHRDGRVVERRDRLRPLDRPHAGERALDDLGRVERRLALPLQVLGLHDAHAVSEQQARQEQGRLGAVDRRRRKHLGHEGQGAGVVDVRVRDQDGLRRFGGQPVEGGQAVLSRARGRAHPRVDEHAPVPDAQDAARGADLARAAQWQVLHLHACPSPLPHSSPRGAPALPVRRRRLNLLSLVSQTRRERRGSSRTVAGYEGGRAQRAHALAGVFLRAAARAVLSISSPHTTGACDPVGEVVSRVVPTRKSVADSGRG